MEFVWLVLVRPMVDLYLTDLLDSLDIDIHSFD